MSLMTPRPTTAAAPRVSVIIPAYNAGRTIDAALESVFAQTYRDFEVIVVDDGSTDDTVERLSAWTDRIVLRRQTNAGPAAARNHAIHVARGQLLAFLDADDLWLPTKLARQVAYFDRFPETGLLHTDAHVSDAPGALVFETPEPLDTPMPPPAPLFCELFHCEKYVTTLTAMAPRDVAVAAGLFDERREFHVEDWDLWLRIAAKHPVGHIPLRLAVYRPDGGMSSHVEKTFHGQQLVIDKATPLCVTACERHRAAPSACLTRREHLLHSQLGYERFWRGRYDLARQAYKVALRKHPRDGRARCYIAASYVGRWVVEPARELRDVAHRLLRRPASQPAATPPAPRHHDLLQDTVYRRTRGRVVRGVHMVDDFVCRCRSGPREVLFEAASPLSMTVFGPVYQRLRDDPRITFWFTATDESWDAKSIFRGDGIADRVLTQDQVRWKKFDAYINTDFWNMTWLPRRTRRVHMFHGVAGKYGLDAPTELAPLISTFDRLMFVNRDRLKRYADAGLVDPQSPRAALIGYPKVDCLVDGSLDRNTILSSLGLDCRKPTILYAPTWSPHSSLNEIGEDVIEVLAAQGCNLIVKLHDRSLDITNRGSGGIDWRARLRTLTRRLAVHLAEGSDACPYLFAADVLVTDHSSVGFEFMLLDRPIVIVDAPALLRHGRINPEKVALLRSAADIVAGTSLLERTIATALTNPAVRSRQRRAVASELFYQPGSATTRAVNCIYELLSLPALAPTAAEVPEPATVAMRPFEVGARQT